MQPNTNSAKSDPQASQNTSAKVSAHVTENDEISEAINVVCDELFTSHALGPAGVVTE